MPRSSDLTLPIRIFEAHNKAIKKATSASRRQQVSRKVFEALRLSLYERVDARARANPKAYHHLYEWGRTGDPGARLFKVTSSGRGTGAFTISYDYLPSTSDNGNGHVFEHKAHVMEEGYPVTVAPVNSSRLVFEVDGKMIVTAGPIEIEHPGGEATVGTLRGDFMYFTRPSIISNNPAYQAVINDEVAKIKREIARARI